MTPLELLRTATGRYDGEAITQLVHGLQSAALAERQGASDALIVAALFHDVGHLLGADTAAVAEVGRDRKHERIGAKWLARFFGPDVTEPVALHVDAKRYLARTPGYVDTLSPESVASLALQGGPMTDEEAEQFEAHPHHRQALDLRRWDDLAKDPRWNPPGLDAWRDRISAVGA